MGIGDISGIVALITTVFTLYRLWKMTPIEVKATGADAIDKYASASIKTVDHNIKLIERIELLEKRNEENTASIKYLESQVVVLNRRLKRRDNLITRWQQGINILLQQLCEVDQLPKWIPESIEDLDKDDDEVLGDPDD